MDIDSVAVVESFYRVDLPFDDWLKHAAANLRTLLDADDLGLYYGSFFCPDPCSFAPRSVFFENMRDRLQGAAMECLQQVSPLFVADGFLARSFAPFSEIRGFRDIPPVREGALKAAGASDALGIRALEADGSGCWITAPCKRRVALSADRRILLAHVAHHFGAAHRVIRNIESGRLSSHIEAILGPDGQVHHASAAAQEPAHRGELQRAAIAMGRARARLPDNDPFKATMQWRGLVARRWTLVDQFERDGRRYVLAVDNRPIGHGWELLSDREREVVRRALRGCENKVIAYDLNLAHSTVKVLIARAAAKFGARTRRELLAKAGGLRHSGTGG